jgi:hypothetical protein
MHFVNDLAFDMDAAPIAVGPAKSRWIDDLRGTMRALGLKTRGGVRIRIFAIEAKSIEHSGPCVG